jgi:putative tryptophan/tyrosine transport system substrate-binding protein
MNRIMRYKSKRKMVITTLLIMACAIFNGCGDKIQEVRVHRVGILSSFEPFVDIADGFKDRMTELGYLEGENIFYDLQVKQSDSDGQRQAVKKFVADKVDLIFAFPTEASILAKTFIQGTDIPMVFAMAAIEGNNLVESISKPGGNITGVRFAGPDSTIKRFEILQELVPNLKRLYITYNINYPANKASLELLRQVLFSKGITLVEAPVSTVEEIKADLRKRSASGDIGMDAILIMPDDLSQSPSGFRAITEFAKKHKVPIGGGASIKSDSRVVFRYDHDRVETGKLAANLADKILRGTSAGTIMVVTPNSYLNLNYNLIQKLGLNASEGLLNRADNIIR